MSDECTHLDQIELAQPADKKNVAGCEECLKLDMQWVHLRQCRECGHVGCCDNSPGKHATGHFAETQHPIMSSIEPGDAWSWCYVDEVAFVLQ